MKLHRAVVLIVSMVFALGLFGLLTAGAISSFDAHSLIALCVVVVAAAAGGIAFSWKRYTKRS